MQTSISPKGTRDFYPEDMAERQFIFSSWKQTCRRYGFEEYDAPMFEHLDLYTQKSGDEIEKQLYTFKDKADRELALRPEITPSLARMVAARGNSLKIPLRWYSIPTLFRYERMQKGRLREFAQLNMDIVGIADVSADAELIAAATAMMRDLGFTADDFSVRVSSRTLLEELFAAIGIPPDRAPSLYAVLDRRHRVGEEEFGREMDGLLGNHRQGELVRDFFAVSSIDEIAGRFPGLPSVEQIKDLFRLMRAYGLENYVEFDIGIVRGLAYYTGIVFELFDKKRTLRAIAGGGRYDKLISLYGGPDTPAVGFAAGDVVLAELLKAKGIEAQQAPRSDVYVISLDADGPELAIATAQAFRNASISSEFSLKNTSVGKQLKQANTSRARYAVFVGGDEGRAGQARIKNMVSGEEWLVSQGGVVEAVRSRIDAAG